MNQDPYVSAAPKKSSASGVLIVAVSIVAVFFFLFIGFIALGIYGFRKKLQASKQAEAMYNVGRITKHASAAFEAEFLDSDGRSYNRICPSSSHSVPSNPALIRGRKFLPIVGDWEIDKGSDAGFFCMKFSSTEPQAYMYNYVASGSGKSGDSFLVIAQGDLDGDGVLSKFSLRSTVSSSSTIVVDPIVSKVDPDE
jgi:hypothetical protein